MDSCARSDLKESELEGRTAPGVSDSLEMVARSPRWDGLETRSLKAERSSCEAALLLVIELRVVLLLPCT